VNFLPSTPLQPASLPVCQLCPPALVRRAGPAAVALAALVLLLARASVQADPVKTPGASDEETVSLDRVVVKGQTMQGASAPFSVETFGTPQIRDLRVTQPQELFRHVPGMNVRNFGLSGVADSFVLRGFGGGGHGGDLGVVVDGIPLNEAMSHADGYVDLNVIVPLEIAGMTVFKGPVSALYGNYNRSGLIALETRKDGAYREADVSFGSEATFDAQAAFGLPLGDRQQLNLAAQHYRTDGYRPQSEFERTTLSARWSMTISPRVQIALAGRVYGGEGDSPSYLTRPQFNVDPHGKDPRVLNDGSTKDFATLRADLSVKLNDHVKLLAFAYDTQQEFTRWYTRPVNSTTWAQREESYERDVWGAGLSLNGRDHLGSGVINWVAGVETFRESTYFQFYDNVASRRRVNTAINDRTADLDSVSLFGEVEAPLHRLFKPWVGVRHDRFDGEAVRNGPETGSDPLGPLQKIEHTSPKVGVRSDVTDHLQLRASWSEGFALPATFIKYSAGASNLDANVFRQTEAGVAVKIARTLTADLAVYRIESSDEIRTVSPGVYQNFGDTERTGVEAKLEWLAAEAWTFTGVYGSAESEVKKNASAALLGRKVTGVPEETITVTAAFAPRTGFGAESTLRYVGPFAVDAANTLSSQSYMTVDATLFYRCELQGRLYRIYLGIDNVFDRKYATSVSLSNGFQLLAPGAPTTFRAGLQLDF
jgi:iron complex outermembrane recepter protein